MKTERVLKKNAIKAYKVFNRDLTCKGFQYEVGKQYHHKGKLKLCKAGFHACQRLSVLWSSPDRVQQQTRSTANMPEFRFRVWDPVRMSYDPPNYPDYVLSTAGKVYRGILDIPPHLATKFTEEDEVVVEISLGMKDKYGNYIYENDILKLPEESGLFIYVIKEGIPYLEDENELLVLSAVQLSDCEVVGNTHTEEVNDFFHGEEQHVDSK